MTLMISFLFGGCITEEGEQVDLEEGELNYLISESGTVALPLTRYNTLNPLINNNESYFYFSKLIFEGLFDFDQNLKPIPRLVSDYKIDKDGKVIIKLREDVLWHDGEKFSSGDVKFTIDALRYGDKNIYSDLTSSSVNINNITYVNIIDEYNLEISFERTSPNMLGRLTFPIVPEHMFNHFSMALQEDFDPVGTGPFKFSSASRSKDIELVANEDYRFNKPKIDKVIGKVLEDDLLLTSFEAGQIDITTTSQVDWDKYKQNNSIDVIEFISANYEFLGFNFKNGIISGDKGQAIRKAIIYGIDRQNIIKNIYLGHASQVDVPIHPESWVLADGINTYGYDPNTSKKHLQNAGFKDWDGDGILEDTEGNKLKFRYLTNPSNVYRKRTAELIKEDLNEIGIELILDYSIPNNEEYSSETKDLEWSVVNQRIENSDFDIVQLGLNMSVIPDIGQFFHTNGNNNFINYANEELDSLITNYESENNNSRASEKLQKYVVDELPIISLFYNNEAILINSKIIGELNPTHYNPYNGLENCFTAVKGH